jgi:hypothetical protein
MYLKNIFEKTSVAHFGLLLHWYSKGYENEHINLNERKKIRIDDINEDVLLRIEEDTIYDIVRYS